MRKTPQHSSSDGSSNPHHHETQMRWCCPSRLAAAASCLRNRDGSRLREYFSQTVKARTNALKWFEGAVSNVF
ncbi:hypothetical protein OYC64_012596 [Pagothenia borchgrevinki]|uniref:Uncharacterized protein n=1 Tax=Pagothenia borchgrevinki TaxID=8213 RepID=A0ABD2G9K8_PAGBO